MRLMVCFILSVLCVSTPVQGTTVKRMDLNGLVSSAHAILVGKVQRSETYWTPDGKLILTRHTIGVNETLKGAARSVVEITTIGGTIADRTLYVSGMPVFEEGEETVLFVESSGPYQTVVGLSQGKFAVAGGMVSNTVVGLDFVDRNPGRGIQMPLEVFRAEIQQRLLTGTGR